MGVSVSMESGCKRVKQGQVCTCRTSRARQVNGVRVNGVIVRGSVVSMSGSVRTSRLMSLINTCTVAEIHKYQGASKCER
jgi:hypothetical protein